MSPATDPNLTLTFLGVIESLPSPGNQGGPGPQDRSPFPGKIRIIARSSLRQPSGSPGRSVPVLKAGDQVDWFANEPLPNARKGQFVLFHLEASPRTTQAGPPTYRIRPSTVGSQSRPENLAHAAIVLVAGDDLPQWCLPSNGLKCGPFEVRLDASKRPVLSRRDGSGAWTASYEGSVATAPWAPAAELRHALDAGPSEAGRARSHLRDLVKDSRIYSVLRQLAEELQKPDRAQAEDLNREVQRLRHERQALEDRARRLEQAVEEEESQSRVQLRELEAQVQLFRDRAKDLSHEVKDLEDRVTAARVELELAQEQVRAAQDLGLAREQQTPGFPWQSESAAFLRHRLEPSLARWILGATSASAARLHLALLACRGVLVPTLAWVRAYAEAVGVLCRMTSLRVDSTWNSPAAVRKSAFTRAWRSAWRRPRALHLVHFQDVDAAPLELWAAEVLEALGGLNERLFRGTPAGWPDNLRVTFSTSSLGAQLSRDLVRALGAVDTPSAGEEPKCRDSGLDACSFLPVDTWKRWALESQDLFPYQGPDLGHWHRRGRVELATLNRLALEHGVDPSIALKIRVHGEFVNAED